TSGKTSREQTGSSLCITTMSQLPSRDELKKWSNEALREASGDDEELIDAKHEERKRRREEERRLAREAEARRAEEEEAARRAAAELRRQQERELAEARKGKVSFPLQLIHSSPKKALILWPISVRPPTKPPRRRGNHCRIACAVAGTASLASRALGEAQSALPANDRRSGATEVRVWR